MNSFSIRRVWYVLRHVALIQRKNAVITLSAVFGGFAVIIMLSLTGSVNPAIHTYLAGAYTFVVGIVLTSVSFGELHDGKRSYAYLMLPASPAEKVVAILLATALLWIPFALLSYALFSLLMAGVSLIVIRELLPPFNPLSREILVSLGGYMIAHALFLFGAVYFRGKNLIKTVAALAALGFGVFIVVGVAGWLLFQGAVADFESLTMQSGTNAISVDALARFGDVVAVLANVLNAVVRYVLPPALWLLTWQRFRETEVAHGV